MSQRDQLFAEPLAKVADFSFDERVVEVFPDMIGRSIPGYQSILSGIAQLAERFACANSNIYDLGCSLGAATLAIRQRLTPESGVQLIGIDNSPAMIERCRLHVDGYRSDIPVQLCCEDINDSKLENASVVVMNFTLQFVPPERRAAMLEKVYNALKPGGALLLSEKFKVDDDSTNELLVDLHHEFKRANGYSELEISQKRAAIEHVMRIDSMTTHTERLQRLGFKSPQVWFQCYNFMSLVAVKPL